MKKRLEEGVKREIFHIVVGTVLLSAVMVGVAALIGRFSLPVVWGALLGSALAILNFVGLAFSVQKAVEGDESKGKLWLRTSYSIRMLIIFVIMIFIFNSQHINPYTTLLPLLFPRITIGIMNVTGITKEKLVGGNK